MNAIVCNFDVEMREPAPRQKYASPNVRDIETLRHAKRVSIFWLTENQRRAGLMDRMVKEGLLELDNSCGYPWLIVVRVA